MACDDRIAMTVDLATPIVAWYGDAARELPWRDPDAGPWAVLVSEIMLQQTPVARVLPAYAQWLGRWPTPALLAADSPAEAVRQWGKLGYPGRALRLHACARRIVEDFGGEVPADVGALLSLPGVGAYTARAVAVFAFGQRHPVVDTNVRRVLARAVDGAGEAGPAATTRDLAAVAAVLPNPPAEAARFSVAVMELGALICTARAPRCSACPIAERCAWRMAGSPPYTGPRPRTQRFAGTDRQVRGLLLDVLRSTDAPVSQADLDCVWPDHVQRTRALASLLTDGLATRTEAGEYALPG
jgi:A/G-specific adenine glycosylase